MALTEDQVQECLLILGLPVRTDISFAYFGDRETLRQAEVALRALDQVNATQEAKIVKLLAEYAPIEFDTDTLKAEGLDSSAGRTRARIRGILINTLGITDIGSQGFTKERS